MRSELASCSYISQKVNEFSLNFILHVKYKSTHHLAYPSETLHFSCKSVFQENDKNLASFSHHRRMGPNHTDERLDSSTLREMDASHTYLLHPLQSNKTFKIQKKSKHKQGF